MHFDDFKNSPDQRPRLYNQNYYCSSAKRTVVECSSRWVVMITPSCGGTKALGMMYREVSWPEPSNAATTLSKRVALDMMPNSVAECNSKTWSRCWRSDGTLSRAAMIPGLKTKVPKSKGRSGSGCVYLIRVKLNR